MPICIFETTEFPSVFELSSLNGWNGFKINGVDAGDKSGSSVSGAGDVNGDGIADTIIGAPYASPGARNQAGASYVIFGKHGIGSSGVLELSSLNGTTGFVLNGMTAGDQSGLSVSDIEDVNNDGIADFLIGAPEASPGGRSKAGTSYVIFGSPQIGGNGVVELSSLNGVTGFAVNGITASYCSGTSASGVKDVNGDGIDDFLIGAPGCAPNVYFTVGPSYVVFGKSGIGNSGTLELSSLNSATGLAINGYGGGCSYSVSGGGDINQDGITDFLIGAGYAWTDVGEYSGRSYVIFGNVLLGNEGSSILTNLNGINGFAVNASKKLEYVGTSVSNVGDVNGDGVADFLMGAPLAMPGGIEKAGRSYVIFGKSEIGSSGSLALSNLNSAIGFALNGVTYVDRSGSCVSGAGDVNGDGIADILIGASYASRNGYANVGTTYVVFGQQQIGKDGAVELSNLNGTTGFVFNGVSAGDNSGSFINNLGDINDDGIDDFIIGAPNASPQGKINAGASYVIFGDIHPTLLTNNLRINQGEARLLTPRNLNATHFSQEPDKLIYYVGYLFQGRFELITNPGEPIFSFTQGQIKQEQVLFIHSGTSFAPSYQVAVSSGRFIISSPQPASIDFDTAPVLLNATLRITERNQKIILSTADFYATDVDHPPSDLLFTIDGLQNGEFSWIQSGNPTLNFTVQDVINRAIAFSATDQQPIYFVSVTDGRITSALQKANVDFNVPPLPSSDSAGVGGAVGAAIGGTIAAAALIGVGAFYIKNNAKQKLEQAIDGNGSEGLARQSEFRRNVFYPIAKKIYEKIKVSGCLGYLSKQTAEQFVTAIQTLLEELQKQGVDLDLNKMSLDHQQELVNHIIQHIRLYTIPLKNQYTFGNCGRFFKAEISPVQIEDKAHAIAVSVHQALINEKDTQRTQKTSTQMTAI